MKYTVESKEVTIGLLPTHKRTVIQHFVMEGENLYAQVKTREEAEKVAEHLNSEEAEYRQMVKDSGLAEWEFLDQNSGG